ncbi:MAG: phosphatidate cytidylyltransferase [Acidimicrobiales bacterium]
MADNKRRGLFGKGSDEASTPSIFDLFEPPPEQDSSSITKIPIIRDGDEIDLSELEVPETRRSAEAEAAGLQHWTEPASGQVPAALAEPTSGGPETIRGPSWQGEEPNWMGPDLSDVFADTEVAASERLRRRPPRPEATEPEPTRQQRAISIPSPVPPVTGPGTELEPPQPAGRDEPVDYHDGGSRGEAAPALGTPTHGTPAHDPVPPAAVFDPTRTAPTTGAPGPSGSRRSVLGEEGAAPPPPPPPGSAPADESRRGGPAGDAGEHDIAYQEAYGRDDRRFDAFAEPSVSEPFGDEPASLTIQPPSPADERPRSLDDDFVPDPPPPSLSSPAPERPASIFDRMEHQGSPGPAPAPAAEHYDDPAPAASWPEPDPAGYADEVAGLPHPSGRAEAPVGPPDMETATLPRDVAPAQGSPARSAPSAPPPPPSESPRPSARADSPARYVDAPAPLAGRFEADTDRDRYDDEPGRPARRAGQPEHDHGLDDGEGRDFVQSVLVGVGMAVVVFTTLFFGPVPTMVMVGLLTLLAVMEVFNGMREARLRPATLLGLVGAVALPVASYVRGESAYPLVIGLSVVFGMLWYLTGADTERPVLNLGLTFTGILWIGGLAAFAALMVRHEGDTDLLAATIIITAASDSLAYIGGRAYGNRRFHPASPGKTWEGTVTGFFGALFAGLAIGVTDLFSVFDGRLVAVLVLAAVVGILAPIGDLAESMVKRDLGIKDMGSLIPSHGGVMDRVDGLLFALPGAFYVALIYQLF